MSDQEAVAQTETAAPVAPETPAQAEANERQALIEAAEGLMPDAPSNENGSPPPEPAAAKKGDAKEEPATPAESRVAAVLRAREQAQKTRDEAASEASKHVESAKTEATRILAEARSEAKKLADAEMASFRAKWREKPLRAIEEAGVDKRALIDDVTREGSAEWQAQRRVESELEKTRAELAEMKSWREEQTKTATAQSERAQVEQRQLAEKRYLEAVPKESALRALYTDRQIVAMTYEVAAEFRDAKPGDVASDEDLRQYLEEQAAQRLAAIRGTSTAPTGSAAKQKANGPRTPSASSASERRGSPKPPSEMNPDELREAQKKAAEDAMSAYASKA